MNQYGQKRLVNNIVTLAVAENYNTSTNAKAPLIFSSANGNLCLDKILYFVDLMELKVASNDS